MNPSIFALLLAVGGSLDARPSKNVAVLMVLEGGGRPAEIFAGASRAGYLRPVRVMPVDRHLFQDGRELSLRAARCGDEPGCLSDALVEFRADFGLVAITSPVEPPLLGVLLLDTQLRRVVGEQYEDLRPDALEAQVERLAGQLLDEAGLDAWASVELVADPPDAGIHVDGAGTPSESPRLVLSPGAHEIRIHAEGFRTETRRFDLAAGERRRLEVVLQPDPGPFASPWLWIGVGVLVAGAAAGVGAAVAAESGASDCACIVTPSGERCIACR